MSMQRKTISVTVENQPGVLARVAGLFSGRNYNIESLAVGETETHDTSRMTIVASGDELVLGQIIKQLNKLVDTIKVVDMTGKDFVEREMALIRVKIEGRSKDDIMHIVNIFRAKVIDVTTESFMIEVTGTDDKINSFIEQMEEFGVLEMVRTGIIALARGKSKK